MPKVFRKMKKDDDHKPVVDASGRGLGVRDKIDVNLDDAGLVILNDKGMSVAPDWRVMPFFLIPEPLRRQFPGAKKARANSELHCFTMGEGRFAEGSVAEGFDLKPDSPKHGVIVPRESVSLDQFQTNLANTRNSWTIVEE
jgi:hypothetical protein